ncbi:MAG: DNA mismatch repair protein MutS [Hyphomicrobiales bacterium]|nr:DNA mismatch repair protein MutS [Hyphomicrobiales bacterium]
MIAQYIEIKAANPDSLLFYRMGDFYELFFEDAEVASRALGITLTSRGQHMGRDIPMCGVPVKAADEYLQRLIRLGHRVAVCEQLEDPAEARKRGAKSVVRRNVTRLVTAGTLTEDTLLDARRANYLAAVARAHGGEEWALAWLDISTGAFHLAKTTQAALDSDLARLDPSELLLSNALYEDTTLKPVWSGLRCALTPLSRESFESTTAERRLRDYFGVAALDAFGAFERAELAAAGAVIAYVELTQAGQRPTISPPRREREDAVLQIDPATRANLELTRTVRGEAEGSLVAAIDRTVTAAGARELAERLSGPLTDPAEIDSRLDAVAFFVDDERLREDLRARMRAAPDLARALSRLALGRGGPRDLAAIRDGLATARALAGLIGQAEGLAPLPAEISAATAALEAPDLVLAEALAAALGGELPLMARDGGFVRAGYREDLDGQRALRDESRKVIAGLQARYVEKTGVKSLKVRHNNVLGYFVDVTQNHGARLLAAPLNESFIHRQTLASAMRFTTVELGELEAKIAAAGERALGIELEIFEALREKVLAAADAVKAAAAALARLDVHSAFAELAVAERHVRPRIDRSLAFRIVAGRHPVVERALKRSGETFIANDCDLGPASYDDTEEGVERGRIWLVTGPNMAGKSTFLRQNALIAILAQTGAFVPAELAHIGIVDRLFSRVGAADDLARGRSTFMVEMVETAAILNQAGPRSLVILDEIGRGTATFDGLSIAWGTVEHLHEVNVARTLFATHFHELTSLAQRLKRIVNATMKVKEWGGDVVFLHEVVPGAADRSYGIQVAKLAGLPASVVARAKEVLAMLEEGEAARAGARLIDDLPLFSAAREPVARPDGRAQAVLDLIAETVPDELTPREALDLVYRIKLKLASDDGAD